jgi:hypothetical protein
MARLKPCALKEAAEKGQLVVKNFKALPSGAKAGVDFGGICGLAEAVPSQTIT